MPASQQDVSTIAALMRKLDLCMLTTRAADGGFHTRPMSNNGEVEFDGDVWFFADAESRMAREIENDPQVSIAFSRDDRGLWLALEGQASIVRDVAKKRELWLAELERWFESGPDDDRVVLIRVAAERAERWGSAGDGVVELR